ncbi:hypothetical protein WJ0W_003337 [Paenibacillus melissococcoides]|uniref:Uncharacterized protein n=1 Tax=Paenibacillus melissococcoides TaxID=2912268 RepID=A0ABM9G440_9BACL|nr:MULTISPECIES: hypothetical protein [Paenibacillus]MEB9893228.1 hypothetical protein [Bacillus cereus]CAH8246100.1 hypothetical protein WJ0W_003337 [Paenibacillus melissococcoides]CAH8712972.1 hypothetical protein WDD9_003415 [Paenibacillus melissococcoides]CAH8713707.1 hypothetical protein HTL2_003718 [Paenibacillus melissococcoides]GIO78699.1 hypothetical protein J6TS7_23090 [Paenibacillus dendritiformis]
MKTKLKLLLLDLLIRKDVAGELITDLMIQFATSISFLGVAFSLLKFLVYWMLWEG